MDKQQLLQASIALWGPTFSGKSWLVAALNKALADMSARDDSFTYSLIPRTGGVLDLYQAPNIDPTERMDQREWLFKREPAHNTSARAINAHAHPIILFDPPGGGVIRFADNEIVVPLRETPNLIMVLDPTRIPTQQAGTAATPQQQSAITPGQAAAAVASPPQVQSFMMMTKEEYTGAVAKFVQEMTAFPLPNRRVAVCITKLDQLGIAGRDPWQLIRIYFGERMERIFKDFAAQGHGVVDVFSVSAFGYLEDPTGRKANYDKQDGKLLDSDHWTPVRVEAPFFWLFDFIERERLSRNGEGVVKYLFQQVREKHYRPYPILRR